MTELQKDITEDEAVLHFIAAGCKLPLRFNCKEGKRIRCRASRCYFLLTCTRSILLDTLGSKPKSTGPSFLYLCSTDMPWRHLMSSFTAPWLHRENLIQSNPILSSFKATSHPFLHVKDRLQNSKNGRIFLVKYGRHGTRIPSTTFK